MKKPAGLQIRPLKSDAAPNDKLPLFEIDKYPAKSRGVGAHPDALNEGLVDAWLERENLRHLILEVAGSTFDVRVNKSSPRTYVPPLNCDPARIDNFRLVFKTALAYASGQPEFGIYPRSQFRRKTGLDLPIEVLLRLLTKANDRHTFHHYRGFDGLLKMATFLGEVSPDALHDAATRLGINHLFMWPCVRTNFQDTASFWKHVVWLLGTELSLVEAAQHLEMHPSQLLLLASAYKLGDGINGKSIAEFKGWTGTDRYI